MRKILAIIRSGPFKVLAGFFLLTSPISFLVFTYGNEGRIENNFISAYNNSEKTFFILLNADSIGGDQALENYCRTVYPQYTDARGWPVDTTFHHDHPKLYLFRFRDRIKLSQKNIADFYNPNPKVDTAFHYTIVWAPFSTKWDFSLINPSLAVINTSARTVIDLY